MHKNHWLQWHFFHQLSVRDSKFWPGRTHSTCQGLGCGPDFSPSQNMQPWLRLKNHRVLYGRNNMVIDTMEGTILKHKNGKSTIYILYIGDFPVFFHCHVWLPKGITQNFKLSIPISNSRGPGCGYTSTHLGTSQGYMAYTSHWFSEHFGGIPAKSIKIQIKSYKIPCFMAIWRGQSSAETDTPKYQSSIAGVYPH